MPETSPVTAISSEVLAWMPLHPSGLFSREIPGRHRLNEFNRIPKNDGRKMDRPKIALITLAFVAFIALGMPDGVLGVAWPSVRADFAIPLDSMGVLLLAAVSGYLISSFSSGPLIARLGVGLVLAASCALTGVGLIGYTLVPAWWMMVLLGSVAGLGAGAIDAGLNTYAATHFSERVMQWLHASYGVGVTLGPIIMTVTLTALNSWRVGYVVVGGFQLLLSACFLFTMSRWTRVKAHPEYDQPKKLTDYRTSFRETLRHARVWLSALLFLLYTGSEITVGVWAYTLLTEGRGSSPAAAGLVTGSYWATFTVGRIVAGIYAKRLGVDALIQSGLLGGLLGAILLGWNPLEATDLVAVALIGFAVAPIFPALVSGTSRRVGARFAANAIGMQMAAASLGTAIVPGLIGKLARQISLEIIPVCLIILFAALFGLYSAAKVGEEA